MEGVEKSRNTRFWLFQLLKLVAIMVIPLAVGWEIQGGEISIYLHSLLWGFYSHTGFVFSFDIELILGAILIACPGLIFVYKFSQTPRERPVRKQLVAAMAAVLLLPPIFMTLALPNPYLIMDPYYVSERLSILPWPVAIAYVFLPYLLREVDMILNVCAKSHFDSALVLQHKRRRFLISGSLAIMVLFFPCLLSFQRFTYFAQPESNVYISGIALTCIFHGVLYHDPLSGLYINLGANVIQLFFYNLFFVIMSTFFLSLILSSLNLLFIRRVLHYFQGREKMYRALWMGLVGMFLPIVAVNTFILTLSIISPPISTESLPIFVPVPLTFLTGYLLMRSGKEIHEIAEANLNLIWPEERPSPEGIPLKPPEVIKVPFWYTILSRFRRKKKDRWEPEEK